jgi:uncharacterized membrane protein
MIIMALDHVRMYFGYGTWYAAPTDLATTTPLLFFTRWVTHFCAPAFVFLAGASACLVGMRKENVRGLSWHLLTRGLWLIFTEVMIVNLAWTFDVTYSFIILQVIWAIGISMIALAALVFVQHADPCHRVALVLGITAGWNSNAGKRLLRSCLVRASSA